MWFMNRRVFVVVTGPDRFPQRMETVDRIFMIPPLFTPHSPSHTKQRSAFPCLCCLCFSSIPALPVFFDFCLSYHFFLCFLAHEICLTQMQKARWFKALSRFKPKDCLMSCSRLPRGRKRKVHLSLVPGFEKSAIGLWQFVWFVYSLRSCSSAHYALRNQQQ